MRWPLVFIWTKNDETQLRNVLDTAILPLGGCVIPLGTMWWPLVFIWTKNDENRLRNVLDTAISPLGGCVIPLGTVWDYGVTFGVHLSPKWQESVKKWSRYGHFPLKRLRDFIEDHWGQYHIHWGSFEPKMTESCKKWARYGHFPLGRLRDFNGDH